MQDYPPKMWSSAGVQEVPRSRLRQDEKDSRYVSLCALCVYEVQVLEIDVGLGQVAGGKWVVRGGTRGGARVLN